MISVIGNSPISQTSPTPLLYTKEIQDLYVRKNFQNLASYFQVQNQLLNFNFFEIIVTAAQSTAQTFNHQLGYTPKDILITQITGSGSFNFLFGQFNSTSLFYTATGPCRVRFFVGTYCNDMSTVQAQNTDIETVLATPPASLNNTVVKISANYSMTGNEYIVFQGLPGKLVANVTTVLPLPVSKTIARVVKMDTSSFTVTVSPLATFSGSISPSGTSPIILKHQGDMVELIADGTNWNLVFTNVDTLGV